MVHLATSPDRFAHYDKHYSPDISDQLKNKILEWETNQEWQNNNLEYELRTSQRIIDKVRADREYGRKLYSVLCNNEFVKYNNLFDVIKNQTWTCSWRAAGAILANLAGKGDYMDWYCSGNEGYVYDEIYEDLRIMGWSIVTEDTSK